MLIEFEDMLDDMQELLNKYLPRILNTDMSEGFYTSSKVDDKVYYLKLGVKEEET